VQVEFGLCNQGGEKKAYGAGLLSSFGELEYSMGNEPKIKPWDPIRASQTEYPITTVIRFAACPPNIHCSGRQYQPLYFLANSFEDAKVKMKEFAGLSSLLLQ
jgi:phenylalanine-4-hydroxylase